MYTLEDIQAVDMEVANAITDEFERQNSHIELIASENWVSKAVMSAMGSVLTNKYAEGYPGKRYYGGCECVDVVEELARERAKELFGCEYANVQPHSGAQANMAVQFAILKPGDTVMGMNLDHGGHLTHGSPVNFSGTYFHIVPYGVNDEGFIDYDKVDLSNLNRQQYVLKDIGKYKTEALQEHLLEINPFIKLKIDCLRLNADNMAGIFAEDNIICEALDAAESKALLVNTIMTSYADKKIVAASGMAGLGSANDITTRKLNNRLYICGDGKSDCTDMSLTAARAAICAGHQAQTVCRIILGLE